MTYAEISDACNDISDDLRSDLQRAVSFRRIELLAPVRKTDAAWRKAEAAAEEDVAKRVTKAHEDGSIHITALTVLRLSYWDLLATAVGLTLREKGVR